VNRVLVGLAAGIVVAIVVMRTGLGATRGAAAVNQDSVAAAPGIAALHRADSVATIHGIATELRDLWDSAAVRIVPGGPPTISRAAIHREDSVYRANYPNRNIVRYVAHYPTLSVHGNTAVEWGGFEGTYVTTSPAKTDSFSIRGDAMRVMKRQADGSWKFSLLVIQSVKAL
jgi:hypothetical protein